ncbi:restriction endonuclease subunit S [Muribaculum gordoncarteri]|uniref:Restriction endonuclease subunit S n=4 Tax=Bacteroidia TaxID=200643 RepID=A0A4P7VJB9_9BACT|nr:restriction endonuclease subunit S [Muribaculum gordoncarteri]QCD35890.1 restriction endonuclease subunit S [Muribaculum gordoncarteri]
MTDTENNKNSNSPVLRFPGFTEPWKKCRLGDYIRIFSGESPNCVSSKFGIIPYYKVEQLNWCEKYLGETPYLSQRGKNILPEGCVVFSKRGAAILTNKVRMNLFPINIDTNLMGIKADNSFISDQYLFYFILRARLSRIADTSTIPQINNIHINPITIHVPSLEEQEKITRSLGLLDERIATQRRLIEDFISLRRALLQNAISRGLSKKSWKLTSLSDILTERGEKNSAGYNVCSVSVSEGVVNQIEYLGRSFAAKETGHYNVARYGDIIYTKSPTGSFPYGIVKRNTQKLPAAISPLYGVFVPKYDWIGILLGYYFESEVNTFNYLHPIIQKGAKNTINITNSGFLANSVPLPTDESEALTLAKCLDTISDKIILEKSILTHYTEQREYLLSKMFV